MTTSHSTRSKPITSIGYLVFVRNEGIPIGLVDNNYFYNKVRTEHVEVLKRNQYN
jgi:hypothetical protein